MQNTDETVSIMLGIMFAVVTALFCFMFPKIYKRVKITKYLMKKSQGIELVTVSAQNQKDNFSKSLTSTQSSLRQDIKTDDER